MSVPTAPLLPHLERYLKESPNIESLAEIAGVHPDLIRNVVSGRFTKIEFPTADRIICALGNVLIWYEDYGDAYWKHRLPEIKGLEQICQNNGCSNPLPVNKNGGGRKRKFCSKRCLQASWHRESKSRKKRKYDKCPHGHDRSPENVRYQINKNGTKILRCRRCMTDRMNEYRARKRANDPR